MAAEKIEECSIRLGRRLSLFRDYATVLLVENNWDEEYVFRQWHVAGNAVGDHVMRSCRFLSRRAACVNCHFQRDCKTYGCSHFLCRNCVSGYVEENVTAGVLNVMCPIEGCEKMMCYSAFANDVSNAVRAIFRRNLRRSYYSAHPNEEFNVISSAYNFILRKKFIMLFGLVMLALFYKGPPRASLSLNFDFKV